MKSYIKKMFVAFLIVVLSGTAVLAAKGNTRKNTTKTAAKSIGKSTAKPAPLKTIVPQTELDNFFKLCAEGNVEELTKLIAEKKILVNAQGKYSYRDENEEKEEDKVKTHDGMTGLVVGTINDKADVVDLLLKSGADVELKNERGWTALMWAVAEGNLIIADKLVTAGAKVDAQNKFGWTALILSAFNGHAEIAKKLLEAGAKVDIKQKDGETALHIACGRGNTQVAEALLNAGAKVEIQDKDGLTPIFYAARYGKTELVELLLKTGISTETSYNKYGISVLMWAAMTQKNPDVVKLLLNAGASVDAKAKSGETALMLAACAGNSEIVEILLQAGADFTVRDNKGQSAMMLAGYYGRKNVIEILLKVEDGIRKRVGGDVLSEAPGGNGQSQLFGKFVNAVSVVNAKSSDGMTPVMYAAHYPKSGDALNTLLDYGVDLKARDKNGHNVLWHLNQNKAMLAEEKKTYSDKIFALMQKKND